MIVNTNVNSLNAQEAAINTQKAIRLSLEKLSTGLRINKASDDASGMAIADKLRTQASSLKQSISNGNSAVALVQIADKAMGEQSNILDIIKQKLIQGGTATTSAKGREAVAKDIDKLMDQLNNIAKQTNYNGIQLLQAGITENGGSAISNTFVMGELKDNTIKTAEGVRANVDGLSMTSIKDNVKPGEADSFTYAESQDGMAVIDTAIDTLNNWRSDFGSTQNQLESSIRNLSTSMTNILAAESTVRDVDYAAESANFNKQNIIAQAGTYAISQANSIQQNVLRLLQ